MPDRKTRTVLCGLVLALSSFALSEGPKPGAEASTAGTPAASKTTSPELKERLDWFVPRLKALRLSDPARTDRKIAFVEAPLLTFENPVSQITDGFMFAGPIAAGPRRF